MSNKRKFLRSVVLDKTPDAEAMDYGQIAINFNKDHTFLSTKNSNDEMVKISDDSYILQKAVEKVGESFATKQNLEDTEKTTAQALYNHDTRLQTLESGGGVDLSQYYKKTEADAKFLTQSGATQDYVKYNSDDSVNIVANEGDISIGNTENCTEEDFVGFGALESNLYIKGNNIYFCGNNLLFNDEKLATQNWVEGKGYLTEHQSLAGYVTSTSLANTLTDYATRNWTDEECERILNEGGYAKTTDIPTKTSDLTNDSDFVQKVGGVVYAYGFTIDDDQSGLALTSVVGDDGYCHLNVDSGDGQKRVLLEGDVTGSDHSVEIGDDELWKYDFGGNQIKLDILNGAIFTVGEEYHMDDNSGEEKVTVNINGGDQWFRYDGNHKWTFFGFEQIWINDEVNEVSPDEGSTFTIPEGGYFSFDDSLGINLGESWVNGCVLDIYHYGYTKVKLTAGEQETMLATMNEVKFGWMDYICPASEEDKGLMMPEDKAKLNATPTITSMTQDEYDALTEVDDNTLYLIV